MLHPPADGVDAAEKQRDDRHDKARQNLGRDQKIRVKRVASEVSARQECRVDGDGPISEVTAADHTHT